MDKFVSLYDDMGDIHLKALASLLGFNIDNVNDAVALGFRVKLRSIPAPSGTFTIGDAMRLYCEKCLVNAG